LQEIRYLHPGLLGTTFHHIRQFLLHSARDVPAGKA
jgi:hypothetical protein